MSCAGGRGWVPWVVGAAPTPVGAAAGEVPLIDTFEGRSQLFASYHMWHPGLPAADQCEGCTFFSGHALELSYLHSRDVTFAVFCQGPYDESARYRDFMGWPFPWYAVPEASVDRLLAGRPFGMKACYLRDGDRVFETYWTSGRGVEPMAGSYGMLDMTVHGRQEEWEDSPAGWPQPFAPDGSQFREVREDGRPGRLPGRPTSQGSRIGAGRSDDLGSTTAPAADGPCCH